ncbi:MAG: Protein phosphatase PhpP [Chlamydiales bacterium]|nr:Protein phosphatase PhpP [Chlamydiales bacterium]MCH9620503.1 Protein phosphatase PhpP [Chlamydiales bacterium]MCH9623488.1 Protein phosphatase PhpP [Chlamydiales bacterium]
MVFTSCRLESIGLSEIGHIREINEDLYSLHPKEGLFLLADGMGGREGGEIAAKIAIDQFFSFSKKPLESNVLSEERVLSIFEDAYRYVNELVFKKGQESVTYFGMGTTLCALYFLDRYAIISHVGDSRIYVFKDKELVQLTEDHTSHPSSHILTRAIGPFPTVEPSVDLFSYDRGDLFLICSDGLSNALSNDEISAILQEGGELEDCSQELMRSALRLGGKDNITLVLVKVGDDLSR